MRTLNLTGEEEAPATGRLARIWASVVWFVRISDYQFAEVFAVAVNLLWLIALSAPGDYLEGTPALDALEHVIGGPLLISACIATLIGPAVAVATGSIWARRVALLTYTGYYASLCAGISAVAPVAVTAGLSGLLCIASAWGYWRLGGRHR